MFFKATFFSIFFLIQLLRYSWYAAAVSSLSHVWLFVTPWTEPARFFCPWDFPARNQSGLPFPSPGNLPDPSQQEGSLPLSNLGIPQITYFLTPNNRQRRTVVSGRKETDEVGSDHHFGFLLRGTFWTVPQGKELFKQSKAFLLNWEYRDWVQRCGGDWNFQDVIEKKELCTVQSLEISIGIPLIL